MLNAKSCYNQYVLFFVQLQQFLSKISTIGKSQYWLNSNNISVRFDHSDMKTRMAWDHCRCHGFRLLQETSKRRRAWRITGAGGRSVPSTNLNIISSIYRRRAALYVTCHTSPRAGWRVHGEPATECPFTLSVLLSLSLWVYICEPVFLSVCWVSLSLCSCLCTYVYWFVSLSLFFYIFCLFGLLVCL